ncbi:MAG: DUF6057 family protein [Bacteroidales bacterium]|nr:DUF6057 family protein [Bacteroidales bacterium]
MKQWKQLDKRARIGLIVGAFLGITLGVQHFIPNKVSEKPSTKNELEMVDDAAWKEDWNKVIDLTNNCWGNTMKAYYRNLAFAHKGCLADSLMHHYAPFERALFYPVDEHGNSFTMTAASEAWWHVGDLTMAEHATMLGMIFTPEHKSTRGLQRLYQINCASGNQQAAAKYKRILEAENNEVPEFVPEKKYCHTADTLRLSSQYQNMLRSLLKQDTNNRLAHEYLLCLDLLLKDLVSFQADFSAYGLPKPSVLFEEAMLILMYSNATLREPWKPFVSENAYARFMHFTKLLQEGNKNELTKQYQHTYWYYFQFAQRNKQ